MKVAVMRLPGADPAVPLPAYATDGAAGADLRANFPEGLRDTGLTLQPKDRAAVPTGLSVAVPDGWEMQIRPRSGLALRHGLTVANAPGTIDADYRGEVRVLLINLGPDPVQIAHGDRIAQAVFAPAPQVTFTETDTLPGTLRGARGFGSTGTG